MRKSLTPSGVGLLSLWSATVGVAKAGTVRVHAFTALDGNTPFHLVLWLNQRHALKASRASVGDEEGQLEIKVGLSQRNSHSANLLHSFGIIN